MNGKVYKLKHVVAFEGWWFDEKVPTVIISEKPLNFAKVKAAINKDFDAQELALLSQRIGRYLKVTVSDENNPSLSGWADNLSFSTSGKKGSRVQVSGGRVLGKVGMGESRKNSVLGRTNSTPNSTWRFLQRNNTSRINQSGFEGVSIRRVTPSHASKRSWSFRCRR